MNPSTEEILAEQKVIEAKERRRVAGHGERTRAMKKLQMATFEALKTTVEVRSQERGRA